MPMYIELENGIEYYWMCCDTTDQLAAFTSASLARIPTLFSHDLAWYEGEVRPLANAISEAFSTRCDFDCGKFPQPMDQIRRDGDLIQWDSSKGIFTYDFAPHLADAEYYLVYLPKAPLKLSDLSLDHQIGLSNFMVEFNSSDRTALRRKDVVSLFSRTPSG